MQKNPGSISGVNLMSISGSIWIPEELLLVSADNFKLDGPNNWFQNKIGLWPITEFFPNVKKRGVKIMWGSLQQSKHYFQQSENNLSVYEAWLV